MKKLFYLFCILISIQNTSAQVDSVDTALRTFMSENNNDIRVKKLSDYLHGFPEDEPMEAMQAAQRALTLAQALKDRHVEVVADCAISFQSYLVGNRFKSLDYALRALKIAEHLNNARLMAIVKNLLALNSNLEPATQMSYFKEAYAEAQKAHDTSLIATITSNIARTFLRMKELDSALSYLHKSVEITRGGAWNDFTLANIYAKMGKPTLALAYYRLSTSEMENLDAPWSKNLLYNSIAQFYNDENQKDSAILYAKKAIGVVKNTPYFNHVLNPSKLLTDIYRNKNNDSAMKYADMYATANEIVNSLKTIQENQLVNFEEQQRQKTLLEEKARQKERRYQNIQYASVAIGIIVFIMVFLLLSRTIIVNERFISFCAVLAFLVFFEYVNLLIHTWLADFTHESPLLMLLALVVIAAFLIEFRRKMEPLVKKRLVEKNKAIRLAAAKKTIHELEEKPGS